MAIPVETFFLDPAEQGTLQARIQRMVAEGILSGRFRRGEKLPSSRKLAQHLGVSRITVTAAYTELVASDYLAARGRSGFYVSEGAPEPPPLPTRRPDADRVDWARALGQRFTGGATPEKPAGWAQARYPFIYGQADPTLFDHANWRLCAVKALGQKDFASMTADQFDRDDPELVSVIARHILPRRGINARPSEILVTMGAQNALWLTAQVLLTQRRRAAIENPSYYSLRDILSQSRCHLAAVGLDEDGMPPEAIPDGTDAIFVTPSHQAPTTVTMPLARRRALLDRARALEALIVEDDYEFEMSFLQAPSPALKSLDPDGRVIYVGSFSKSLFPGLRLGYLVGSEPFIREARALRASVLRHPPGLIQRTVAHYLSLGHYQALIRRMGRSLGERRKVMEEAIRAEGLEIAGKPYFGGSAFWMKAPEGTDTDALAQRLLPQGVVIEPGAPFFAAPEGPCRYYRLAYSSIPADRIAAGVKLIAEAM